jgi:hypothetical protein
VQRTAVLLGCCSLLVLAGCAGQVAGFREAAVSTEVALIKYHVEGHIESLEEFTRRLYVKNPKYEPDPAVRERKIASIFRRGTAGESGYAGRPSHEVLAAAFARQADCPDRVYLLSLGLVKSIKEGYRLEDGSLLWSGMQVGLEPLERLHHNLSQVNWRLKTYRDEKGELLFRTNEAGEDGYLNMGYEVIVTRILTRIQDDIHLRGGLPRKYFFSASTLFLSILL